MKRIKKVNNDQFYTKKEIAINLINSIDFNNYQLIIDPCCGDGSFYLNINHLNKIAIDIDPKIDIAIKQDYLLWEYTGNIDRPNIICISNPPFGKQASLAIKFINKSAEFCDTIAFILPLSFTKNSIRNKINKKFHIIHEEELPKNSFEIEGKDYDVPCVFQIWQNMYVDRPIIKEEQPIKFTYTKDPNQANLSVRRVGFYAGRAYLDLNKSKQSHYFLIIDSNIDLNNLVEKMNKLEFKQNTTGPKSISKGELNKIINLLT
jgi:predicted RNA methylase